MTLVTGVVKWFDGEKGSEKDLHEGEGVTFDIQDSDNGPMAVNVQKL